MTKTIGGGNSLTSKIKRAFLIIALLGIMAFGLFLVGCDNGRGSTAPQGAPKTIAYVSGLPDGFYRGQEESSIDYSNVVFNVTYENLAVVTKHGDELQHSGFNTDSTGTVTLTFTYTEGSYAPISVTVERSVSERSVKSIQYNGGIAQSYKESADLTHQLDYMGVKVVYEYDVTNTTTQETSKLTYNEEEQLHNISQGATMGVYKHTDGQDDELVRGQDALGGLSLVELPEGNYFVKVQLSGKYDGMTLSTPEFSIQKALRVVRADVQNKSEIGSLHIGDSIDLSKVIVKLGFTCYYSNDPQDQGEYATINMTIKDAGLEHFSFRITRGYPSNNDPSAEWVNVTVTPDQNGKIVLSSGLSLTGTTLTKQLETGDYYLNVTGLWEGMTGDRNGNKTTSYGFTIVDGE